MPDRTDPSVQTVGRIAFGRGVSKSEEAQVYTDAAVLMRRLRQENEELKRQVRAHVEHCRRRHGCDVLKELKDD